MISFSGKFGRLAPVGRTAARMVAILFLGLALAACQRKTPEDILSEAVDMARKGDILGAEMKYEKLLEKNVDPQVTVAARYGLSMCYMSEGEYDRGREQLDEIIKLLGPQHPDAIQFYGAKVDSYFREKKPEKAVQLAEATSATLHGAPELVRKSFRLNLADFYIMAKQEDKATQTAHQLIREWPDDSDLHIAALERIVGLTQQKQQWAKAISIYEDYLKGHPTTNKKPELLYAIGSFQKMLGQTGKSNASFDASEADLHQQIKSALGADAKGEMFLKLARVQQGRGNITSATANLQRVIKDFPGSDSQILAKFRLTEIALSDNKTSEAIGYLTQVIRERPDTNFAYNAMQLIQQIQNQRLRPTTATLGRTPGTTATLSGEGATTATQPAPAQPATATHPTTPTAAGSPKP